MNNLLRILKIVITVWKYGLDDLIPYSKSNTKLRFIKFFLNLSRFNHSFEKNTAIRFREALESLGPIFVKFGQLLSTRRDILPEDIANELALLQDKVKPFNSKHVVDSIEKTFKKKISDIFSEFSMEAAASASIAQVHFGILHDGRKVAVKVLRPKMLSAIEKDIRLMQLFATLMEYFSADGKRLRPKDVVSEFNVYLHDEIDLVIEAANASQLKRNFSNSKLLKIPEMFWEFCSSEVIIMERVYGIPINRIDLLEKKKINLVELSHDGVEIFFTQVFRDGFFHADMHPGNILVGEEGEFFGKYVALDFGIVGSLTDFDKGYLARNFLAFFRRDYKRVAELHIESGWVPQNTRIESLESAIRTVCEPYFDKPLKDISLGQVLLRLFQTSRRFDVRIQPQLVLLQKTLLNIEGLGRQLNPNLDLWATAKPFLENWMKEQIGFPALKNQILKESELWAKLLPQIPRLAHDGLKKLTDPNKNELTVEISNLVNEQKNIKNLVKIGIFTNIVFLLSLLMFLFF